MSARKRRARKLPAPDHVLVADIRTSNFSYFISSHRSGQVPDLISDEAIIELHAQITKIEPPEVDHIGKHIECSLICARTFNRESQNGSVDRPALYSITFRRDGRSLLVYLPGDAFWAIQNRLEAGTVKRIKARYIKPARGSGDLTSLYLY